MKSLEDFLDKVRQKDPVEFEETIGMIDSHYQIHPVRFTNGVPGDQVVSDPGVNLGSLKIFSFACLHGLDAEQTLNLFGKFYREDVLLCPEGHDHPNIRTFIRYGWDGVRFDGTSIEALQS